MNIKTTLILILAALLGLTGIFGYKQYKKAKEAGTRRLGALVYENYPVNEIAKVTLRSDKDEVTVERDGNHWVVADGSNFRARYALLANLLAGIYELRAGQEINVRKSGYQQLKVAHPDEVSTNSGCLVETFLPDGSKASSFIIGRTKSRGMDELRTNGMLTPDDIFVGQYVRLTDEEKPMLVKTIFKVNPLKEEWRDTAVLKINKDEIEALEGPDYALSKAGDEFTLADGAKPNSGVLMRLVEPLVELRAKKALSEPVEAKESLKVALKNGQTYVLSGKDEDGAPSFVSIKASFQTPDRGTNEVTSAEKAADLKSENEAEQFNDWFGRFVYEIDKATYKKLFVDKAALTQPEKAEEKPEGEGEEKTEGKTPFDEFEDVQDA